MLKSKIYRYLLLVIGVPLIAFSQIEKAIKFHKDADYKQAKQIVDSLSYVIDNEQDSEIWYVRGMVYETLYVHPDTNLRKLADNALYEAFDSYLKAKSGKKNTRYIKMAQHQLDSAIALHLYKEALLFEKLKRYRAAASYFDMYVQIKTADTSGYTHLALNSYKNKNNSQAIKALVYCIENLGYESHWVLKSLIHLYKDEEKKYQSALEIARRGMAKYPADLDYKKLVINILLDQGAYDAALVKIDSLALSDKGNLPLYYNLIGTIHQKRDSINLAINYYNLAIKLQPDYAEANYNLGGIYYERARVLYAKVNSMDYALYQKNGKKLEYEANQLGKKALPYLEKAYTLTQRPELAAIIGDLAKNLNVRSQVLSK